MAPIIEQGYTDTDTLLGLSAFGPSAAPSSLCDPASEAPPQSKNAPKTYVINVVVCPGTLQTCKRPSS
eukprot:796448-Alexandrium_andersonii.AAC.1